MISASVHLQVPLQRDRPRPEYPIGNGHIVED